MTDSTNQSRKKVADIFNELVGDRAKQLSATAVPSDVISVIADALSKSYPEEISRKLAYHTVDWGAEAAFVVAILLYPEKFTPEEIRCAVSMLLINVPGHVVTAKKLADY